MEKQFRSRVVFFLALALLCFSLPIAEAQEFPTKPVTLVNPGGAGGSHDLTARAITSVATEYLGQPIIIKLMGGAGGSIGSEYAAKSAPDGYTLNWGGPGWSSTLPAIEGKTGGPDDFVAVCRINYSSGVMVARKDAPYKTFQEMLMWAKANPRKLVFGTTGPWGGADLAWKQIVRQTGIDTKFVPYQGGEAVTMLLGGHTDMGIYPSATTLPHIKSGKLIALAIVDDKRHPALPDLPSTAELGMKASYRMWRGVLAPKGTPRPIIDKLAMAFKKMSEDKSAIAMIHQFGDEIQYLGPDDFAKVWREEYETHKEIGKFFKK
jgi:tripartite-type tricarboxylate transporter receptor subunit TctC